MRVLISIFSLASINGGPTRSSKGLACALAAAGAEVSLLSHIPGTMTEEEIAVLRNAGVDFLEGRGIKYSIAREDCRKILAELKPDLVHVQGMWKMSTHAMNVEATRAGVPVVISPRGMLDPWALSVKKWKKRLGMMLYQHGDLKRAKAFHATTEQEAQNIRDFGLAQPIIIAPNGVALPDSNISQFKHSNISSHSALFLSRLHPGKGLMLLAEAWAKVRPQGWRMVVAGSNEQNHREAVEARLTELGIADDWQFVGEVKDCDKWDYYRSADLFIHPSASENFGISICEALAMGVPVITTKGCPWSEIVERKCGWWVERTVEDIATALREATRLSDDQRLAMGASSRKLVEEKYTWPAIGEKVRRAYEGIVG